MSTFFASILIGIILAIILLGFAALIDCPIIALGSPLAFLLSILLLPVMLTESVTNKGDIVTKSKEKLASIEDAVDIINQGYYYIEDDNGNLNTQSISQYDICFDNSIDGLYIEERYYIIGIIKTDTVKVLVVPESIKSEISHKNMK